MLKKLLGLLRSADSLAPTSMDELVAEPLSRVPGHVGNRRTTNFWDPIYGSDVKMVGEPYDWDLERNSSPTRCFIPGETLTRKMQDGETLTIRNITFRECDFQGLFQATTIVMFDGCQFIGCDFAYSTWNSAHFKKCSFINSSLAMAAFEKCEFRECTWDRIGVSGNKTDLVRTFIDNPKSLVGAMFSGLDPKKASSKKHACHQWYRLGGTRAHVLRTIMLSHATVGDEHVYYRTVELHELQRNRARLQEDWYHLRFSKGSLRLNAIWRAPLHALNLGLMWVFGLTNGWGESVSQPSMLLGSVYAVFGAIYAFVPFSPSIDHPWQKSFDITLLIGFTNHNHAGERPLTMVQDVQAVLAVILYTVFFSTLISKLSRTR